MRNQTFADTLYHRFSTGANIPRRIRKKYYLGEYAEYGFSVRIAFVKGADGDKFMDDFIDEVEALGMECGGGGSTALGMGFGVNYRGRGFGNSQLWAVRGASMLSDWLHEYPAVSGYSIGADYDSWYGDGDSAEDETMPLTPTGRR